MNRITPSHPQLTNLQSNRVVNYAREHGWRSIEQPNQKLHVLQYTDVDVLGKPIKLVLPQHSSSGDSRILFAVAINLLAETEQKEPENILAIMQDNSDRLLLRDSEVDGLHVRNNEDVNYIDRASIRERVEIYEKLGLFFAEGTSVQQMISSIESRVTTVKSLEGELYGSNTDISTEKERLADIEEERAMIRAELEALYARKGELEEA